MDFPKKTLDYRAPSECSMSGEDERLFFSPFRDAAATVAAAGLVPLPCGGPIGKAPLVKWRSLRRPISPPRLNQWLADPKFADANIGIATGPSGITVIDCDTPDSLDELIAIFGPTPLIVATPRGGFHLYFRSAGEGSRPLSSGNLKIDVKGVGGFIVIPPSIRRSGEHAGKVYRFIAGLWADIQRLPTIKRGALASAGYEHCKPTRNAARTPIDKEQQPHGRDVGRRNRALFDALRAAAPEAESRHRLKEIANAHNQTFDPPLDDAEVTQTVDSVWRYLEEGRLFVPGQATIAITGPVFERLSSIDNGADGLMLLACLIRNHGARSARNQPFAIVAAKMAQAGTVKGWTIARYRNAISTLLEIGCIARVHKGGRKRGDPHKYLLYP